MGDRSGAAGRLADAATEDRAHVFEELLVGLLERPLQLLGHRLAAVHQVADLHAELDRPLDALLLLGWHRLDGAVGERVDLLEHARHRGQVGRLDLGSSGTICLVSPP